MKSKPGGRVIGIEKDSKGSMMKERTRIGALQVQSTGSDS